MKGFDKVQALKNVGSSWFGLGVTIAVGILLSPYIIHHLGDEAYGIWVLVFSLTGYYGLFDLGIRSSIIRFVSKYRAVDDQNELTKLLNTTLFGYIGVAMLLLTLTGVGAVYVDRLFHVAPALTSTVRWVFVMVGASLALGFPLGMFGGVLEGLQRFYWLNMTNVLAMLVRAALTVVALHYGYGLLMVTFITVLLPMISAVVRMLVVFRLLPIRYGLQYVSRSSLRQVGNYGAVTFMIIVAARLRFKTDAMVIGAFLSSSAITFFSIGARPVDYAAEIVSSLAQIFTPMSSHFDARGDRQTLRNIFVLGNRACALVMFPLTAVLLVLGKAIIEVWVGAKYVSSYPVMVVLLIPVAIWSAQATSGRVLMGMGRHKTLAMVTLGEGIANLVLSIVLVQRFGILGDAFGTAIPLFLTCTLFLPRHLCKELEVPVGHFLVEAYSLPLSLSAVLAIVLFGLQSWFRAHNYWQLLFQIGVGGGLYCGMLLWYLLHGGHLGVRLPGRLGAMFGSAATAPRSSMDTPAELDGVLDKEGGL